MMNDFLHLFYPRLCLGCNKALLNGEGNICTFCNAHLPKTDWHLYDENPLKVLLKGRIKVQNATSYLHFTKGEMVQNLLHQLKYKNKKQVGNYFGALLGNELSKIGSYSGINAIVPVPLHWTKEKRRGYNQSEAFANGLSLTMCIPVLSNIITRISASASQTHKSRYNRWENVENIFGLFPSAFQSTDKHLLLVDDVITTGSTLEACAQRLIEIPGVTLSVASIACA